MSRLYASNAAAMSNALSKKFTWRNNVTDVTAIIPLTTKYCNIQENTSKYINYQINSQDLLLEVALLRGSYQSVSQSVISQSVSQSASQPASQPASQSVISQSVSQSVSQPASQPASQPVSQSSVSQSDDPDNGQYKNGSQGHYFLI